MINQKSSLLCRFFSSTDGYVLKLPVSIEFRYWLSQAQQNVQVPRLLHSLQSASEHRGLKVLLKRSSSSGSGPRMKPQAPDEVKSEVRGLLALLESFLVYSFESSPH
jgi:hypothetical protein